MDTLFIFGAHYLYLFALASALYFFWTLPAQDKISIIVFSVTSLIATYIMVIIVGHLYYDPRPFTQTHIAPLIPHDPDNGFPSDHTVLLSAIACTFYPFSKKDRSGCGIDGIAAQRRVHTHRFGSGNNEYFRC